MLPSSSDALPLPASPTLLLAALDYRSRGWSIIPVVGKRAAGLWRPFQERPADDNTLRSMFARPGVTGLAVVCGAVSGGLAIRDYDDADAYHAWATANPADAATLPTVQTAQGFHVYGILEAEHYATLGDGELRGDSGHYTLLPPALHPSGIAYRWLHPLPPVGSPLPALPDSLWGSPPKQPSNSLHVYQPEVLDAIRATLPAGPGQRNRKVFELVRRLKALDVDGSPSALKVIVIEWHSQALPNISTKDFAETWSDFQIAWLNAKTPFGASVRAAYEAALRAPEILDGKRDLGILAGVCKRLGAGGTEFFLSVGMVQDLFGVPRMTAWRMLNGVRFHDVIEPIKTGTLKDRQATTWRYIDRFTDRQQGGTDR